MTALPRAIMPIFVLALAIVPTPYAAAADECVRLHTANVASGLRLWADTEGTMAFGFQSGSPGDGVKLLLLINTVACSGFGTGLGVAGPLPGELEPVEELIPLP